MHMSKLPLIYLAAPYTHSNPKVVEYRMRRVNKVAAQIMASKLAYVFSPLSHGQALLDSGIRLPTKFEFWKGYCTRMVSMCDRLVVLCLPGWQTSVGVQEEIRVAQKAFMPITYVWPKEVNTNLFWLLKNE